MYFEFCLNIRYLSFSVTTQHRNAEQVPLCFISLEKPKNNANPPKLKAKNLQTPHPNTVLLTHCIFQPRKLVFYLCEGIKDKAVKLSYSKFIRILMQVLMHVPDSHSPQKQKTTNLHIISQRPAIFIEPI